MEQQIVVAVRRDDGLVQIKRLNARVEKDRIIFGGQPVPGIVLDRVEPLYTHDDNLIQGLIELSLNKGMLEDKLYFRKHESALGLFPNYEVEWRVAS